MIIDSKSIRVSAGVDVRLSPNPDGGVIVAVECPDGAWSCALNAADSIALGRAIAKMARVGGGE